MLPDSSPGQPPPGRLPEFAGPLDLLLDEVRRQNVAVENIVMAPIVARFLDYVRTAAERNLTLDMEWLHMAATLIHWKSQALLPRDTGQDPRADPVRDELVRQLLAHRQEAAEELGRRRAVEETRFSRAPELAPPGGEESEEPAFVSVWDLIRQARDLACWAGQQGESRRRWRESFEVAGEDVTVSEMMDHLRKELASGDGCLEGVTLLESQTTASRRSCLFLGMLEMARAQEIEIQQNEPFGSIAIMPAYRA